MFLGAHEQGMKPNSMAIYVGVFIVPTVPNLRAIGLKTMRIFLVWLKVGCERQQFRDRHLALYYVTLIPRQRKPLAARMQVWTLNPGYRTGKPFSRELATITPSRPRDEKKRSN
jgi:hypothetical protein